MTNYTHDNRRFGLHTPLGKDVLLLSKFEGHEPISGLFSYALDLVSENDEIVAPSIVGKPVTFWVQHPDDAMRYFQGHVSHFYYVGRDDRLSRYRAQVVPWLWFLTLNSDCRIFQNLTIPDIIRKVLTDRGCTDFDDAFVTRSYPTLEYCVQYNESDFTFISRLMEEAGIFYYFSHEQNRLLMKMADSPTGYSDCKDNQVEFSDNLSERSLYNQIWKWEHRYEFRPGKFTHKDFNFKDPGGDMLSFIDTQVKLPGNQKHEVYQYPGNYDVRSEGDNYARLRIEVEEAAYDVVNGESYCRSFSPAARFRMIKHHSPREEGKSYIITSIDHTFDAAGVFVTGQSSSAEGYSNQFSCIPAAVPYRPPRQTPIARVRGPQTAMIVGPAGEEIYTDEHGRVKVQFHWDREGQRNENSSCWMRVSQVHAGAGWGMMDLPRIGEEVIVSFLEGDPDRPIITGRVYNGMNRPPFSLPAEKTRRGNSTKTHKGAGYNEMSMDDTVGKEQLRMNAMYNMNSNVNNDQTLDVGNNQTEKVAVDRTRTVGNNEKVDVGVNKSVKVGTNHDETIGTNQTVKVGTNQSNTVGMMKNETVGMMSNEMVGLVKTLNAGAAYSIIVGGAMNTAVAYMSAEEIGVKKSTTVGGDYKISAGTILEIVCGSSKLTMESGGKVTISGTEFNFTASGAVKINGAIIDLN